MISILATMAVVTAIDMIPYAEAKKGQGVYNQKYGSGTKGIVCGDRLCSEVGSESSQSQTSKDKMKSPTIAPKHIGGISIDSIKGATLNNANVDRQSGIATISVDATDDGKITVNLLGTIKDVFMVIVDGEEWDDAYVHGGQVKVYFHAGTEKIEIIGNVSD